MPCKEAGLALVFLLGTKACGSGLSHIGPGSDLYIFILSTFCHVSGVPHVGLAVGRGDPTICFPQNMMMQCLQLLRDNTPHLFRHTGPCFRQ